VLRPPAALFSCSSVGKDKHPPSHLKDHPHRRIIDMQGVAGEELWAEFSRDSPLEKSGFELAL
jgi:hypothetical protein